MKLLGIDDAGRGPVVGPMVLAGVLIYEDYEKKLKELGAKDSKLLLPKKRQQLKKEIEKLEHKFVISTPPQIDAHPNLNKLEAEKTAAIINALVKEKTKVIVDCPSSNPQEWQDHLVTLIHKNVLPLIQLSCEHKADANHPVVSAASIIAKETREEELVKLKAKLKIDFGSGYPSDPATIEFIKDNYNNPEYKDIIRHSWNTVKRLQTAEDQKKLF